MSELPTARPDRGPAPPWFPNISRNLNYNAIEIHGLDIIRNTYYSEEVIFEECRLFRDVAHTRSLSRAAQLNGISQSAATQHIQQLESKMGVELLDRTTRPLGLTAAGRLYADLCRDVLRRGEDFMASMADLKGAMEGTFRIASIYSIGLTEMPRLREEFARVCPGVQLLVEFLRPNKVYDAVLSDHADIGFISYPEPNRDLTVIPWREEQMVVAAYPSHPFAGRTLLQPDELDGQNFVAFDQEVTIHRELERFFRENAIEVSIAAQFDNIQSIKEAVAQGAGISILPERSISSEVEQHRLLAIPLDAPELVRPTAIIHRKKKKLSRAGLEFLQLIRSEVPAAAAMA